MKGEVKISVNDGKKPDRKYHESIVFNQKENGGMVVRGWL
jgi:hypothetical protein